MDRDWLTVYEALRAVYSEGAYSNIAVNEAIRHHKGCRDSFVRTYAKGTIRDTLRLDHIIGRLAAKGLKGIKIRTLIVLRMGVYAIDSLDSVPDHAAVNEAVSLARGVAKGTDKFVNGVLRSYIRRRDEFRPEDMELSTRYSFPHPLTDLLQSQYGEETEAILKGLDTPPPLILRVNRLRTDRDGLIRMLADEGITASAADGSANAVIASGSGIVDSAAFREGYCSVQSLSSMQAIEALSPAPGSRVLDMCAAPGGKSSYMAELMGGNGSITACDIHVHRLELIDAAMKRLGIGIVETALMDGTVHDSELDGKFDYVLADVPCSGLGVAGSKPEIKYRTDTEEYPGLRRIQAAILRNAVSYAAPGGLIEYSTCTLNKDENEAVVREVLADAACESETGDGSSFHPAINADGYAANQGLLSIVEMHTILPYNNSVGFFYCILRKGQ